MSRKVWSVQIDLSFVVYQMSHSDQNSKGFCKCPALITLFLIDFYLITGRGIGNCRAKFIHKIMIDFINICLAYIKQKLIGGSQEQYL